MSAAAWTPPPGFRPSYEACPEVIEPYCSIKYTTIGYSPILGINAFLAASFGLSGIAAAFFGVWKRTWGYSIAVTAGCMLECAGYIGRCFLSRNPWDGDSFKLQIVSIVLGPTLLCVGLYLTIKHAVIHLNPSLSRVKPRVYPWFFVPADISCLVIQAIGGGVAASARAEKPKMLEHGNRLIIAGICLQVVVLGCFGFLSGEYLWKVKKWIATGEEQTPRPATANGGVKTGAVLWRDAHFRTFMYAMMGAYATMLIRCIYRIAEMAGGWGNHIMQDEPSFIVLESFMVLTSSVLLAVFAPGVFFPGMSHSEEVKGVTDGETSGNEK